MFSHRCRQAVRRDHNTFPVAPWPVLWPVRSLHGIVLRWPSVADWTFKPNNQPYTGGPLWKSQQALSPIYVFVQARTCSIKTGQTIYSIQTKQTKKPATSKPKQNKWKMPGMGRWRGKVQLLNKQLIIHYIPLSLTQSPPLFPSVFETECCHHPGPIWVKLLPGCN